jgi:hypothetical protein
MEATMRGWRFVVGTAVLVAITGVWVAATTATVRRSERRPDVIQWPDSRFPTVQRAIDALPDGGTLRFPDGVVSVDEPLFVRGKRIVIEGAGCDELPGKNTKAFAAGPQAGLYGDGVTVVGGTSNGMVWVTDSFIENAPHSGVANYGAFVSVGDLRIQCALFDLEGEVLDGKNFSYTDLGGMKCGCPTANGTCAAATDSDFQAPAMMIPIP